MGGVPYYIEIDIAVLMNESVSHADHLFPRHGRQLLSSLRRYSASGLANDFQAANNSVLTLNVLQEFLFGFVACKRKDQSCSLKYVQQIFFISVLLYVNFVNSCRNFHRVALAISVARIRSAAKGTVPDLRARSAVESGLSPERLAFLR